MGRKIVLQLCRSSVLDKCNGDRLLTSEIRGRSQVKKVIRARRTVAS